MWGDAFNVSGKEKTSLLVQELQSGKPLTPPFRIELGVG
jgi:hypothetical protein